LILVGLPLAGREALEFEEVLCFPTPKLLYQAALPDTTAPYAHDQCGSPPLPERGEPGEVFLAAHERSLDGRLSIW